jgi:hypothetical protein
MSSPVPIAALIAPGPYQFLSKLFSFGTYFCNSSFKYLGPVVLPLNPINIINWIFFFTIFFIVLSIPPNVTNSSDSQTKSGWRTFGSSFLIYYGVSFTFFLIILLIACKYIEQTSADNPDLLNVYSNVIQNMV